ncbi:glycosyltransferase family 4 protein [Larkinella insperata]|uniref:Glycosyltransferase family 4 protein n=1 Tax=Larkinella insperata TaxID=332158 RepID=A0ABW3QM76_9BACT|nr:glycosyltransferase family 4 protein [Larkinella insperata]
MAKVGIYYPEWILARHNTDYKIAKSFFRLQDYSENEMLSVASNAYTWSFNLRRIANQVIGLKTPLVKHGLSKKGMEADVIYHYSSPVYPNLFFKALADKPVLVTTGFMTDRYMIEKFGSLPDRQKEADLLASKLEPASMIHFHTENGRQRFLRYRPEFKEKTISIPFFLPDLSGDIEPVKGLKSETIHILFVGNEGNRKGLKELIAAFDLLGATYLNEKKVELTVVSKDKPEPKTNFDITWHVKLPHADVMQLMRKASIFTLIPKRESYGLVLVEAMLSGCAIISDNDETREEIIGNAGVLLSSNTPESISIALKQLIEDAPHRTLLGEKARQSARDRFLPGIVANQYATCFEGLLI